MRMGMLLMVLMLAGCGRDWSTPEAPRPDPSAECGPARPCLFGVCTETGWCDETACVDDADCRYGLCGADGECNSLICADDEDCLVGLCAGGRCDASVCETDEDCAVGMVCVGAAGTTHRCLPASDGGPALVGDPGALTMRDNLESARSYVLARHPEAQLVLISGLGLKVDGSVDIRHDYLSRWMYGFIAPEAAGEARQITVTYCLSGTEDAGLYDPSAGNVTAELGMPRTAQDALLDSSRLAQLFGAEPGCLPLTGQSADSVIYKQTPEGPWFVMSNAQSQSFSGDPVTGEATASCD